MLQPGSGDLPVREKIQKKWLRYGAAAVLMTLAGLLYCGSQIDSQRVTQSNGQTVCQTDEQTGSRTAGTAIEWQLTAETLPSSQETEALDGDAKGPQSQDGLAADGKAGLLSDGEAADIATVYVCGAVQHPGVYELPGEGRICDAVEAAGGFTEEADTCAVNLAEVLTDGSQIYIPTVEESAGLPQSETAGSQASNLVNLNTATKEQLMELPGIGAAKAEAILSYRESVGKFSCIEEIMNVSGIKEASFSKIRTLITV